MNNPMNPTSIVLTAKELPSDGIVFVPTNGTTFTGNTPEVRLWSHDEVVTIHITDDTVLVTTQTHESANAYVTSIVTRTTTYRCPVRVQPCLPDFSVFNGSGDDDIYVPGDDVPNFGMFSDEGNLAVEVAVLAAIDADNLTTATEVAATVKGHPEVNDTVVRDYIHAALLTAGLIRN